VSSGCLGLEGDLPRAGKHRQRDHENFPHVAKSQIVNADIEDWIRMITIKLEHNLILILEFLVGNRDLGSSHIWVPRYAQQLTISQAG